MPAVCHILWNQSGSDARVRLVHPNAPDADLDRLHPARPPDLDEVRHVPADFSRFRANETDPGIHLQLAQELFKRVSIDDEYQPLT